MVAGVFLAVYGFGVPLVLSAIMFWAKGGDGDIKDDGSGSGSGAAAAAGGDGSATFSDDDDDDDDDNDSDTTVAVRRLSGGALLLQGGGRDFLSEAGLKAYSSNYNSNNSSSGGGGGNAKHLGEVGSLSARLSGGDLGGARREGMASKRTGINTCGGCGYRCGCGRIKRSKGWRSSGQWVLAVRKAMSNVPDSFEVWCCYRIVVGP